MQMQVVPKKTEVVRPSLVKGLLDPEAYPDDVQKVTLVETHASYLFMTGRAVYKVKKAVDYGFLDFTTLPRRRYYCHREVSLNARISPDVYLGVVPVREKDGRIRIGGPGETIEYAVKMRQLPADRALDTLLAQGKVDESDMRDVAARIAAFHGKAATGPDIVALGSLDVVRQNVEENFEQTARYIGQCLTADDYDDIVAYSRGFMEVKADEFERRALEGHVRDGHGDLHAGNIFMDGNIRIIDCIEFNDRFRCADVAEDVAFLAMDLDHFEHPDLSEAFVSAYVAETGDSGIIELLDFFKAYRAYVRGKVTSFRLDDPDLSDKERQKAVETARTYFKQAHAYAMKPLARPTMVMVSGLMGSGKTSVAREVARRGTMEHIYSDVTRKALAGVAATEHRYEPYGQGLYSTEDTRRTCDAMLERAGEELTARRSVVLDGSFRGRADRLRALDVARRLGADAVVIECVAPDDEIRRRLDLRTSGVEETESDGRWELYRRQQADWDPMDDIPEGDRLRLNTIGSVEDGARAVIWWLFVRAMSRGTAEHVP